MDFEQLKESEVGEEIKDFLDDQEFSPQEEEEVKDLKFFIDHFDEFFTNVTRLQAEVKEGTDFVEGVYGRLMFPC